jgi:hypothetical protein
MEQISVFRKDQPLKWMLQIMLKLALFVGLSLLLYYQLLDGWKRMPVDGDLNFLQRCFSFHQTIFLILAIVLMPLNWTFEALKWRILMPKDAKISFSKTVKAVLAGITFSLFTPNRIGEYGGRVLFVNPENRVQTVFATIKGSIAQWLAILSGGLFGILLIICSNLNTPLVDLSIYLLGITLIIFSFMLILYFRMSQIIKLFLKIPFLKSLAKKLQEKDAPDISIAVLNKTLVLALLRYLAYSLQYFFILEAFDVNNEIVPCLSAISIVYLLQTGLPVPPTFGLLARGSIAVWIFGMLGDVDFYHQSNILAATFSLWFINLFIPALLGTYFIAARIGKSRRV